MLTKKAIPCLVDLGAWANFNKMSFSADRGLNRSYVSADDLNSDALYILKSADFFLKLASIQEGPVFSLLADIAQRKSLLESSRTYPETGLSVAQVVGDCPLLRRFYNEDCARLYSLIQYFELLFLIEMIVMRQDEISTIKFILPNDEDKYYPDIVQMEIDITAFLQSRLGFNGELNIQLLCFEYGKRLSNRPYLNTTQGLIDKDMTLSMEDIIDETWVMDPCNGGVKPW